MRRTPGILKDERGVVLLLVLATMALFTVMVVNFSADEGLDIELASNFRDSMQAQYIARSGVEAAIALFKNDDTAYDSTDEDWGDFNQYSVAASAYLKGPSFSGDIIDESGKFDLNSLANKDEQAFRAQMLKNLFHNLEIDIPESDLTDLVRSMQDWLDKDSETDSSGAENEYYQSLEKPYICKNGPMDSPEEILLVKGMKPEYYYGTENYKGIKDYVTVGTGGKININTAPDIVLKSISERITDDVVEKIKAERPYKTLRTDWAQYFGISGNADEMKWINDNVLTNKSTRFRADMKGTMPSGAMINIRAVLERSKDNQKEVRIVYYKIY